MKTALSANYMHRRLPLVRVLPQKITVEDQKQRVRRALKDLGMTFVGLNMLESRWLPKVLTGDEQIGGVVYGHSNEGNSMLVATDKRLLFLDRKPLFSKKDEISYDVVSGVSLSTAGLDTIVTLHTRIKDYAMRSFNQKCASGFVRYIEGRCLQHRERRIMDPAA